MAMSVATGRTYLIICHSPSLLQVTENALRGRRFPAAERP